MKRLLLSLVRPLRLIAVEHPHGAIAVGGRTALLVRALGHGTLGRGDHARVVDGAFDGVLFVDVVGDQAVVEARALFRRQRRAVAVAAVTVPPAPPAPQPALPEFPEVTVPTVALPAFTVSIEVP